jgi:pectate lyase
MNRLKLAVVLVSLTAAVAQAASKGDWRSLLEKPDDWFRGGQGQRIVANVLSWQSPSGSWPKNLDPTAEPFSGDPRTLRGTFDNSATTDELRFLARAFRATQAERCREAFLKGVDHVLHAQYPTGGWPQFYPPDKQYHRYITFNDDTMVRLLDFVREVATKPENDFVDAGRRQAAQAAFERGIQCILKCQVVVHGTLTVWCAQHDEITLEPRPGRAYEQVSLSGAESVRILELLMNLDYPADEVIRAVDAGLAWFDAVRLTGIRIDKVNGDKVVVADPAAPPLWARFYEIGTNRPFFCGRDGVKKYRLAEIEAERRNGYAWYGEWGARLPPEYRQWKKRTK